MSEPRFDEDVVNLGYLKRALGLTDEETTELYKYISRHYGSRPQPPYYVGDTWIDGEIVYTCIKERLIGTYQDADWTTESGAKQEAERKNKVFLRQPDNYAVGDMWVLQSDNDHKAGKKGEMLITTVGRLDYDEDDWVNMLGYGTIRSINEVANNINDALNRMNLNKTSGVVTIFYADEVPINAIQGDLWYVTETVSTYTKGNVYKYNNNQWESVADTLSVVAFEEANEARLVADGKIQSFYNTQGPINAGVGDIWTNTTDHKLYRYNGTKWVAVYDTNISEVRKNLETVTTRVTNVETDTGNIKLEVYDSITDRQGNLVDLKGQVQHITNDCVEFIDLKTNSRTEINGDYITTGTIKSNNYVANTSGTKITLSDGSIDSKYFKVNSSGQITSTGGTIGGFTIGTNEISSTRSDCKVTLADASNNTKDFLVVRTESNGNYNYPFYVRGNGFVHAENAEITGNITGSNITSTSISNGNNFTVDANGNMSCSNATITGGKITINGEGTARDLIKVVNTNNNSEFSYIQPIGAGFVGQYGRVEIYAEGNNFGMSSVDVNGTHGSTYVNDGEIKISSIATGTQGRVMHGRDTYSHYYTCEWTGSQLNFWVDNTNVGTLSDKRLKTEIQDIDKDFIEAIKEIEMKQFKVANRNGLVSFGILAQDLIEIFKKYNKNPLDYEIVQETLYRDDDKTIYYKINYEQFLVLKTKAQELEINELKEKDIQKDKLIKDLVLRVEKLEGGKA